MSFILIEFSKDLYLNQSYLVLFSAFALMVVTIGIIYFLNQKNNLKKIQNIEYQLLK
jgi:hypothetical protein